MGLFSGITSALSSIGSFAGSIAGGLAGIGNVSSLLGVTPFAAAPTVQQVAFQPAPILTMAARVPSGTPLGLRTFGGAAAAFSKGVTSMLAPILIKIAQTLGRRTMTLRQAVKIIRRTGKFLGPAGVAAAIGITVAELAELIVADQARPRRRMNPANITALRRSMRRISSFHRLCQKADTLRAPRRRSSKRIPQSTGSIVQVK